MLLAADIGGTHARLLAFSMQNGQELARHEYASQSFASLPAVVNAFREHFDLQTFAAACFGLPGPVDGSPVRLTNLPWQVDANELRTACAIEQVCLINDFQAAALGVDTLEPGERLVLHAGAPLATGHRLVAGAGTGLGVAPAFWDGSRHIPVPCEGGHIDFAPANDMQQDLLRWLWQEWSHASCERILSGAGLAALHAFLSGSRHPLQLLTDAEGVTRLAEAGDETACRALETFVAIYGSVLGNLALLWPARNGIYIAGGIAGKILPWLQRPAFLQALHDKGRMQELVQKMPVYLVTGTGLGLRGAALKARHISNYKIRG